MAEGQSSIDAEKIKQLIKEVLAVVDVIDVPEQYKEACFKVLFSEYLERSFEPTLPGKEAEVIAKPTEFTIPDHVRAFLSQHEISEPALSSFFKLENGQLQRKYRLVPVTPFEKQIHVALLAALENALNGRNFEFSFEQVRQICTQYDCYLVKNFTRNFKARSVLFRSLSNKEHVELSPEGKEELAKIIKETTK